MCATIWINYLGIAIIVSSRIKHGDWFMLVLKTKPIIRGLQSFGSFDAIFRK